MRREGPSGRKLTDRNIIFSVFVGVALGGLYALHVANKEGIHLLSQNLKESNEERAKLVRRMKEVKEEHNEIQQKLEDAKKSLQSLREDVKHLKAVYKEALTQRDKITEELQSKATARVSVGKAGTVKGPRASLEVTVDESVNSPLASALRDLVRVKELLVTFADVGRKDLLTRWLVSVKRLGIADAMVIAFDAETQAACKAAGAAVFLHLPSGPVKDPLDFGREKFRVLRDILAHGYKVLVADVDVVFIKNPLAELIRDCDVEVMSAVATDHRAYGEGYWIDDPSMGWARYAVTTRWFFLDPGFFYLLPSLGAVELVDRVVARIGLRAANDTVEAVFNKELFLPSSREYSGLYASVRVMDFAKFINPRYMLKGDNGRPVVVGGGAVLIHANVEKDKEDFVAAAEHFATENSPDRLIKFNSKWDSAL